VKFHFITLSSYFFVHGATTSPPYHHPVPLSWNLGTLTSWNHLGHSRPAMGLLQQPHMGQSLLIIKAARSHSDTPHSLGLLWMSGEPDPETSTWQHTNLTRAQTSMSPAEFELTMPANERPLGLAGSWFFYLARQPPVGHGLLIHEVYRSHSTTHHNRQDSFERVISSSQRPLPVTTQRS